MIEAGLNFESIAAVPPPPPPSFRFSGVPNDDGVCLVLQRMRAGSPFSPLTRSSFLLFIFLTCICSVRTYVRVHRLKVQHFGPDFSMLMLCFCGSVGRSDGRPSCLMAEAVFKYPNLTSLARVSEWVYTYKDTAPAAIRRVRIVPK